MKGNEAQQLQQANSSPPADGGLQLFVCQRELSAFESSKEAEHLRRLEADQDLILHLSAEGFDGRTWDRLSRVLVEYGLAVMTAWIASGLVYWKLVQRGIKVESPTEKSLNLNQEDVSDLAADTVSAAIVSFQRILGDGRWNPGRGATLATYFVGNCLLRFPNVLRAWKRDRLAAGIAPIDGPRLSLPDVESAENVVLADCGSPK